MKSGKEKASAFRIVRKALLSVDTYFQWYTPFTASVYWSSVMD